MQDYVVFDMSYLFEMAYTLWYNLGNITGIALYAFIIVLSIFLIFNIVSAIVH